ncbi:MAG: class I SAM-dependent methyltransferase [Candidatus Humimicrobiaceae bacterium]
MLKQLERKLICPVSGNKLYLDDSNNFFKVKDRDIEYPIDGRIIDFLPEEEKGHTNALKEYRKSLEDQIKDVGSHFKMPDKFIDTLVEVPADISNFAIEKYRKLKQTTMLVVDENMDFLMEAERKAKELGIDGIYFLHCSFDKLPVADKIAGLAISILGLSRVKGKGEAIAEIHRVLKVSGTLLGIFFINHLKEIDALKEKGIYLEAFKGKEEIKGFLDKKFDIAGEKEIGSKYLIDGRKRWPSCGVKY